ncbi:HesA/MoeB/ThiF family protein [Desertibaculum subflavum]|uniref:HesA/MoeB/ThiF family protein n=1 Tax=Desertibaculum subflavum TaxID=2268458 RepID=UPI000E66641E
MPLSDSELDRYARHIVLREVGGAGQQKLKSSRVLVVGAGGLGSPLALYLAAAGVGTLHLVDDDTVSLSNLQRQIAHTTARVGERKTASAAAQLRAINPEVTIVEHATRITAGNARELIGAVDLVADGSDNFDTRFLINDACHLYGKPLVSAAVVQFDGQLSTFKSHIRGTEGGGGHPCYRCLYREPPPPDSRPNCAEAGILGAVAGVMGTLQATEVLKELIGIGDSLSGRLLIYDALSTAVRTVRLKPDPACPLCGPQATIKDLSGHA